MNPQERLIAAITASKQTVVDARDALRHVNELIWQRDFSALLDLADTYRSAHSPTPQPSIANDYANLAGLLRQIRFSEEDKDRERFRALRGVRGSLLEDTREILDCAAQMDVRPNKAAEPLPDTAMLEIAGREGQLIALQNRIANVEKMLTERLVPEAAVGQLREQTTIVKQYVVDMRRYTTSIKLSIKIGDSIDLAVIERAASAIGRATVAMIDTVRAKSSKASQTLRDSVAEIGNPVKRLIGGVRVLVQLVRRSDARSARPIPNDYLEQSRLMILEGKTPPEHWIPQIRNLYFGHTELSDITPLSQLSALTKLDLRGTQVVDVSSLSELIALKSLYLMNTDISDISSLSHLVDLQHLDISGTAVKDITPLKELFKLENLYLLHTAVKDISPLGKLTKLERLYIEHTKISDISSLSKLNLTVFVESSSRLGTLRKKIPFGSRLQIRCQFH